MDRLQPNLHFSQLFLKLPFISTPTFKFLSGNTTVLNVLVNLIYTSKTSKRYILRYKALCRIVENAGVGDGDGGHFCFVNNMILSIFCFEELCVYQPDTMRLNMIVLVLF